MSPDAISASGTGDSFVKRVGPPAEPVQRKVEVQREYKNYKELETAELQGAHVSISDEQLIKAIEKAVKAIQGPYTFMEFSVHEKTKRISIKVHDQATGEVIREIPPEKTLDFVAKLWEMAGILIDERR